MADIIVKGYVNAPRTKNGEKGAFCTFSVTEKQKEKNGEVKRVYYNVTDFNSATPPNESAFVTVGGWLKIRDYLGKDGVPKQSFDIIATNVDIAPPLTGKKPEKKDASSGDPWDLNK